MTNPKSVMVVEDEPNIAESIKFLLNRAGYAPFMVTDGRQAIEQIGAFRPDLLILDIMMPFVDGFEVLRFVRKDARFSKTKVLMLSAKGQIVDQERAREMGANAFISKPFANKDLMDTIAYLLNS